MKIYYVKCIVILGYFTTTCVGTCDNTNLCTPCFVNNEWKGTDWTEWSECSEKCAVGNQERTRYFSAMFWCCSCPSKENPERNTRNCGAVNNGCGQNCKNTDGSCSCNAPAYSLNENGKSCDDVNECETTEGVCQQKCKNTVGSYKCECNNGYYLHSDEKSCKPRSCVDINFSSCPTDVSDDFGSKCSNIKLECSNGKLLNSVCNLSCETNYALAIYSTTDNFGVYSTADFANVKTAMTCLVDGSMGWSLPSTTYQKYYCRRKNDPPKNLVLSKLTILEYAPLGTVIGDLSVEDISNDIDYSVESSEGVDDFELDKNKLVNSKVPTLKDLSDTTINVAIKATNNGIPPMFIKKTFTIGIINVNDAPKDLELSNKKIKNTEPINTVIGKFSAVDFDSVDPQRTSDDFIWSLVKNDNEHFKIVGSDLVLNKVFDKEEHKLHLVVIKCTDKQTNPKSVTQNFYINVINENSRPAFITLSFASLDETTGVNNVVGYAESSDDKGEADIKMELIDRSSNSFRITTTLCREVNDKNMCKANIELIKQLDYEKENEHTLIIKATDSDDEYLIETFVIKVNDRNEQPSSLICDNYKELFTNAAKNVFVASIKVEDEDVESHHTCEILNESSFTVSEGTYNIIVASALDRDKKSYNLQVKCTDNGEPSYSIQRSCVVNVKEPCIGPQCDRDPTLCDNVQCGSSEVCSIYKKSTKRCIPEKNQMGMLLPMPPAKNDDSFMFDFEDYVTSIIDGDNQGKSLTNMKGTTVSKRRKRRKVEAVHIEGIIIKQLGNTHLYVTSIPRTKDVTPVLLLAKDYCPKFVGTDIQCISKEDCIKLAAFNVTCPTVYPIEGDGNTGETKKDDGKSVSWVIGLILGLFVLIILVVIAVVYIRRRRKHEKLDDRNVMFNNQSNTLSHPPPNNNYTTVPPIERQRLPFEDKPYSEVTDVRKRGDIKVMNNDIYIPDIKDDIQDGAFEVTNPAYGLSATNIGYVPDDKKLNVDITDIPLYASIGKSAGKSSYDRIDISSTMKARELEDNAEAQDNTYDHMPRRGASINQYDPNIDDKEKVNKKPTFSISDHSQT